MAKWLFCSCIAKEQLVKIRKQRNVGKNKKAGGLEDWMVVSGGAAGLGSMLFYLFSSY
jgi:hypothetical protein